MNENGKVAGNHLSCRSKVAVVVVFLTTMTLPNVLRFLKFTVSQITFFGCFPFMNNISLSCQFSLSMDVGSSRFQYEVLLILRQFKVSFRSSFVGRKDSDINSI